MFMVKLYELKNPRYTLKRAMAYSLLPHSPCPLSCKSVGEDRRKSHPV